jgi:hypothetical protein
MQTASLIGDDAVWNGERALAHFASVYYHRGPEQKHELISLLQSDDLDVVGGLLALLRDTCGDLDADGAELSGKPLGGAELPPTFPASQHVTPSLG